jgi:hypothetical protein
MSHTVIGVLLLALAALCGGLATAKPPKGPEVKF